MVPPVAYRQAREKAHYHVQVAVLRVGPKHQGLRDCEVEGEVVRVFRDRPGDLADGKVLRFTVDCIRPGEAVLAGGTLWTGYDRLQRARYIEVYLYKVEGGVEVARWQSLIIEKPSYAPRLPVE